MQKTDRFEETFTTSDSETTSDALAGLLQRVTFHNEETGYTIGRLIPDGLTEPVTIIGNFINPTPGESFTCRGAWKTHPQWGRQFQVNEHVPVRPVTSEAIEKYLASGLIKGIGPVMAKRIVAKFGPDALDVIDTDPSSLSSVLGMGKAKLDQIKESWTQQHEVRTVMIFLQSHGVSPAYATKIYQRYGSQSIDVVETNPFRLADDVWGIGFKTADKIASNLGIEPADPRRISAAILYHLNQQIESGGHTYVTRDDLIAGTTELLAVEGVELALDGLITAGLLVSEAPLQATSKDDAIYPPLLYAQERGIARWISDFVLQPVAQKLAGASWNAWFSDVLANQKFDLSSQQTDAVRMAIMSKFCILTGGPGVGKTTTTNAIVAAFESQTRRVMLASPTGRAAKRLSDVTNRDAKTVHRLLEYDPSIRRFKKNAECPINCDVLIVDEASMLDTNITSALLSAVPPSAQVIFVGDVDQLPSVGPGSVLNDLIKSETLPVAELTEVFRQAAQSLIVRNAHAINRGVMPELPRPSENLDCAFVSEEDGDMVAAKIAAIVGRSLPARGFRTDEIQVLTPMQRGSAGAIYLNERLQHTLNPPEAGKPELIRGRRTYRAGDRVMQTTNDYEKSIFNGDIGTVIGVNNPANSLVVQFGDNSCAYDAQELDQLTLAYACTIHKSQGSEYPAVVLACHTQHYVMLQRNLLYTGLTRARKIAVIVGSKKAISMAVSRHDVMKRSTRLSQRLADSWTAYSPDLRSAGA